MLQCGISLFACCKPRVRLTIKVTVNFSSAEEDRYNCFRNVEKNNFQLTRFKTGRHIHFTQAVKVFIVISFKNQFGVKILTNMCVEQSSIGFKNDLEHTY